MHCRPRTRFRLRAHTAPVRPGRNRLELGSFARCVISNLPSWRPTTANGPPMHQNLSKGSVALRALSYKFGAHEMPDDRACYPRSHLPLAPLRWRDHRAVNVLGRHLMAELPRPRGDDGGAADFRVAHHDSSWVNRYVPEFEERWNRYARPVNTSWCELMRSISEFGADGIFSIGLSTNTARPWIFCFEQIVVSPLHKHFSEKHF